MLNTYSKYGTDQLEKGLLSSFRGIIWTWNTIYSLAAELMYAFIQLLHHGQNVTQGQYFKLSEVSLKLIFLLLDWLPNHGYRTYLSYYLPIAAEINRWIHTFPKSISAK